MERGRAHLRPAQNPVCVCDRGMVAGRDLLVRDLLDRPRVGKGLAGMLLNEPFAGPFRISSICIGWMPATVFSYRAGLPEGPWI